MSLLSVELRRLLARRAVVVLLVASVLGTVVVASVALWQYRPASEADIAAAEQQAEEAAQRPIYQRRLERCVAGADTAAEEERCQRNQPRLEWYLNQSVLHPRQMFEDLSIGLVLLLGFTGLLVGTTFMGAEFSSGSLVPLLLVRPRRPAVWAAKLAAGGCGVGVAALLAWGAAVGLVLGAAYWGWAAADPGGELVRGMLLQALRGVAVTAVAGVIGVAVTAAFRSTVAGLGAIVGYVVVAEGVGRLAITGSIERVLLSNHLFGTVLGHWTVQDYSTCDGRGGEGACPRTFVFSLVSSGWVLAAVVVAVLVASLVTFGRRDIG